MIIHQSNMTFWSVKCLNSCQDELVSLASPNLSSAICLLLCFCRFKYSQRLLINGTVGNAARKPEWKEMCHRVFLCVFFAETNRISTKLIILWFIPENSLSASQYMRCMCVRLPKMGSILATKALRGLIFAHSHTCPRSELSAPVDGLLNTGDRSEIHKINELCPSLDAELLRTQTREATPHIQKLRPPRFKRDSQDLARIPGCITSQGWTNLPNCTT